MEGKSSESSQNHSGEEGVVVVDLKGKPKIGDLTWVKLSAGSWWPALVVGSNDKLKKGFCVRLYGSFECMLVDPSKWRSEFQIILNENNGCYQEIFRKTLEKEMSRSKVRGKRSKSKGTSNGKEKSSSRKQTKNDAVKRKTKGVSSKKDGTRDEDGEISGRSPELSARRIRVMQLLGLAAPSGSPFKNGLRNPSF